MEFRVSRRLRVLGVLSWAWVAAAGASEPTAEELGELAYSGVYDEPVQLHDGVNEGPPVAPGTVSRPRVVLAADSVARGDLDGDGRPEAAVLLLATSGGTGVEHYVAVVAQQEDGLRNVATAPLGDRIQIMLFEIAEGGIRMESIEAGPKDAMCCPTQKVGRTLKLAGDRLEGEPEVLGRAGLADLGGRSWVLEELDRGKPPVSTEAITLELSEGQLVGSAGCNRYFTDASSKGGQNLSVGPVGATRRMCPPQVMEDEQDFLSRLQQVNGFRFSMGHLALEYEMAGSLGALKFRPARPEAAP